MKKPALWFSLVILSVIAAIAAIAVWQIHPRKGPPGYVTSSSCRPCHQAEYRSWKKTLHSAMFRPVTKDTDLQGNFTSKNPLLIFSRGDVEYVVGNRWEQVYLRKIDGEYYPFPASWYVKQKKWAAYKVHSWQKTPMSLKCNGCHTTGFDPATYKFAEFGVGCEACHGPGSRHVANRKMISSLFCRSCHGSGVKKQTDIIRTVSSAVCGQCHNRGKNKPFYRQDNAPAFNFPVQYVPGKDLNRVFKPNTPAEDKKNRYWWGNGVAKARHQEFADWGKSRHSRALTNLKQNSALTGEKEADACLECHSADYRLPGSDPKPTIHTAKYGVTCVVCHNPHAVGLENASSRKRNSPCVSCHTSTMDECFMQTGLVHYPCPQDKVECVDCHMPYVVKSGGWYSIRGHAFRIMSPLGNDSPNSCQNGGCHQDRSIEWVRQEYRKFYKAADKQ